MTALTIVASIKAKADKIDLVRAALEKLIDTTRAEKGCINYDLHQDNQDPAHFLLNELGARVRMPVGDNRHRLRPPDALTCFGPTHAGARGPSPPDRAAASTNAKRPDLKEIRAFHLLLDSSNPSSRLNFTTRRLLCYGSLGVNPLFAPPATGSDPTAAIDIAIACFRQRGTRSGRSDSDRTRAATLDG